MFIVKRSASVGVSLKVDLIKETKTFQLERILESRVPYKITT